MRISEKDVRELFVLFCKEFNFPIMTRAREEGHYFINTNFTYGGHIICSLREGGGERNPFGCDRKNSREMYDAMHFALNVKYEKDGYKDI